MTWLKDHLTASPHLLDLTQTEESACQYGQRYFSRAALTQTIRDHKRAIEHEEAVVRGLERAYALIPEGRLERAEENAAQLKAIGDAVQ